MQFHALLPAENPASQVQARHGNSYGVSPTGRTWLDHGVIRSEGALIVGATPTRTEPGKSPRVTVAEAKSPFSARLREVADPRGDH